MSPEKIRVGVIGVGIGTSIHIPGFQACSDIEVTAVCSARQGRAEAAAKKFGIPNVFTDYREMLELDRLDAVAVTSPPHLHYPITIAALEANKHVLCEKPMAMNLEEVKKMYQEAENRKLVHMINHEFRFLPARVRMKELVEEGYLGQLLAVHSSTLYG
ncbi:MAG: Gfo/Idh/MocA family oxidoreductase, partial [Dehalococcoidales bacterium]